MKKLIWKSNTVFNVLKYWYAGHDEGTTRFTFNIDQRKGEEYPYRLTMYGNYLGDFRTLKAAKDHANTELNLAIQNLKP